MADISTQERHADYCASFDVGGMDDKHRADHIMADFATAFSLDMDYESPGDLEKKWPTSKTIVFAIAASLGLWTVLASLAYFVFIY